MLALSSSEDVDVISIKARDLEDLPLLFFGYEDLLEVVNRAVAKLNIEWTTEKQEAHRRSKLDECFLQSKSQPPRWACNILQTSTQSCQDPGTSHSPLEFQPHYFVLHINYGGEGEWLWDDAYG